MLLPSKSKLMESLIQTCSINDLPDGSYKYVIDGGHLMHTMVPWQKQKTFEEIANRCIEYVIKESSRNCAIVFDGCPVEPTTKGHAREYRSEAAGIAPEVQVDPSSRLDLKKEQFLANNRNKQAFINLLSHSFRNRSVSVRQANDDADLLIATTAIDCAMSADAVVVAQDTDVITLC